MYFYHRPMDVIPKYKRKYNKITRILNGCNVLYKCLGSIFTSNKSHLQGGPGFL